MTAARSHAERFGGEGMVAPRRAVAPRAASTLLICDAVAAHYGITRADILGPSRAFQHVRPRQVVMYLARRVAQRSFPQVSRVLGRHHTTVLHASRMIAGRMGHPQVRDEITTIAADIARRVAAL